MKTATTLLWMLAGLAWICLPVGLIGFTIYGLYVAFSASVILGIIVLIIEPSPLVIGIVAMFRPDVCEQLAKWLGLV